MKKNILSRFITSCALLMLILTVVGCNSSSSPEPKEEAPAAASASLVTGIYSGTYDGKAASFICSGSDCVIAVDGKPYAKGVFTDLQAATSRAVGYAANLTITEKVNSSGILCTVAAPEKITFSFPPTGSTDPIKITVNGITSDVTREVTYVVTFDHQNGEYSELPVKAGTVLKLDDPIYNSLSKGNYSLMSWCLDKEGAKPAPNPLTVTENTTLYAKWKMVSITAPVVTNVSDGISIPVDSMPDETCGLQLFRVNADGSWSSLYYRNKDYWTYLKRDFKGTPILYPFVEPGKECRYIIQFYDSKGLTAAVSEQFNATAKNGVGEISVTNQKEISFNINDDGTFAMSAAPKLAGTGVSAIKDNYCDFEFWKGNGWESEAFTWVNELNVSSTDITTQRNLYQYLLTNYSVPMPSGSKCFIHMVMYVKYGEDSGYRVVDITSAVHTLTYDARWRSSQSIRGGSSSCVYTNTKTATGATIAVSSDPDNDGVSLIYVCDAAQGKSCSFTITIKNNSSDEEMAEIAIRGEKSMIMDSRIPIPAGENKTITINDVDKIVTVNPILFLTVEGGSFAVSNPTVTEN